MLVIDLTVFGTQKSHYIHTRHTLECSHICVYLSSDHWLPCLLLCRYWRRTLGLQVRYADCGGYRFCYSYRGKPGMRPSILMLHGFSAHKDTWLTVVKVRRSATPTLQLLKINMLLLELISDTNHCLICLGWYWYWYLICSIQWILTDTVKMNKIKWITLWQGPLKCCY